MTRFIPIHPRRVLALALAGASLALAARPLCAQAETPAAPAAADAPAEAALPPVEPLDPATADPTWQKLFAAVAAHETVFATFTERRWFSVRKQPVLLRGELRHSREHGLSLRYTEPEEQMMIIDARGILLRNAAGRSRALKTDPRAPQIDAMLLHVLRFDLAALHERFEIRAARSDTQWRLEFVPRTADLARALGRLTVAGADEAVRYLEFSRGPKQRVEVLIEEARTGVEFTPEDLRRFFR